MADTQSVCVTVAGRRGPVLLAVWAVAAVIGGGRRSNDDSACIVVELGRRSGRTATRRRTGRRWTP